MKTFLAKTVTAAAVCTLIFVSSASAGASKMFARYGRHVESSEAGPFSVKAKQLPDQNALAKAEQLQAFKYPRYRLIDLGTLGGPNASQISPGVTLNNRGEMIAMAGTAVPEWFPDFPLQDGFIWHAILSDRSGVVTDLGALGGYHSLPFWISKNGLITGVSQNGLVDELVGIPQMRAVLWDKAHRIIDLGTLGGNTSFGSSVNNRGQVTGAAANNLPENPDVTAFFNAGLPAAQQIHAFLHDRGAMRDLGTLGGNNSTGVLINEPGEVAGFSATDSVIHDATGLPTIHPFLWRAGQMLDLGTLGGSLAIPGSIANGYGFHSMNERGDIAGTSTLAGDEDRHAFIYTGGMMLDIGTLGGNLSDAIAINNKGQVVGRARTTDLPNSHHPFLWEKGQITDLGVAAPCTRGTALSINDHGQVVGGFGGCSDDPEQIAFFRALYWQKGSPIVDLNELITPASNIVVDEATAINDRGEIVGAGILPDGSSRAVLLVPIPPGH
jgi:probable HAF family extracellular repeat protein